MPVGWVAGAAAVAGIAGAAMSADAAKDAARTQRAGAADASQVQREMFDLTMAQQQPFMRTGYAANDTLSRLMGLAPTAGKVGPSVGGSPGGGGASGGGATWDSSNGRLIGDTYLPPDVQLQDQGKGWYAVMSADGQYLGRLRPGGKSGRFEHVGAPIPQPTIQDSTQSAAGADIDPQTGYAADNTGLETGYLSQTFGPEQFLKNMDPGYGWRLQQGAQGVMNTAAAGSGSLSGPALKALMEYNQGAASQEYGAAFNRFQTQQGNIFQRLSSIANLGQNAAAGVGQQGVATGGNIGANIVGAANAGAAGQVGSANAWAGALDNASSLGMLWAMNRDT